MTPDDITGLVLAGGRGARMGGVDKGLQTFNGEPLALRALQRLRGQVGQVALNANRHLADYEAFGVPVWADGLADYPGPLAGFLSGLAHCTTPYLLTVPCDTPFFPLDLAARLADALATNSAQIAIASAPDADGTLRPQPVFCLMQVSLHDRLVRFTAAGGRKVRAWADAHGAVTAAFDQPDAFVNTNTMAELHALESR